jgi:ferredoxin, 2Fe-2S
MAKVTWVLSDGTTLTDDVSDGTSLMDAARLNDVPNILGDCGGTLSCATCHVYVDGAWQAKCGTPSADEAVMLDIVSAPRQATSRLSCQLVASAALDGIVLHVPAE